jgi:hypothetical protein
MKAKIDIENRKIIGHSGKVYKINPEGLSIGRAAEFQIRGILLGFKTDFETLLKMVDSSVKRLEGGKTFGDIADTINELKSFRKGMLDYQLNTRPTIIEFCSLFCIGEGEDIGTHTEDVIREKYDEWKTIPDQDFFFLCANVIPHFRESYLKALKGEQEPT